MRFARTTLLALVGGFALASSIAGPAAAYTVVSEQGAHGEYFLDDSTETPAGTCKFGPVVYSNWAYFKWMRINPPHVFAADRNSQMRDHRVVSWQFALQRATVPDPVWTTVQKSAVQKQTAYEDVEAPFSTLKVKFNAETRDPDHMGTDEVYRALVILKWYRPNGSIEATVKLAPTYYQDLDPRYTYVGSQPYCGSISTDG